MRKIKINEKQVKNATENAKKNIDKACDNIYKAIDNVNKALFGRKRKEVNNEESRPVSGCKCDCCNCHKHDVEKLEEEIFNQQFNESLLEMDAIEPLFEDYDELDFITFGLDDDGDRKDEE
jgi:hypothetical protein